MARKRRRLKRKKFKGIVHAKLKKPSSMGMGQQYKPSLMKKRGGRLRNRLNNSGGVTPAPVDTTSFITTWSQSSGTVKIPTNNTKSYNGMIQWENLAGDILSGPTAFTAWNDSAFAWTLPAGGTYRCRITGLFEMIDCYNNHNSGTPNLLIAVEQLGSVGWKSFGRAFEGSSVQTVNTAPCDVSLCTGLSFWRTFFGCNSLTSATLGGFHPSSTCSDPRWVTMVHSCGLLTYLDISGVDFSNATGLDWALAVTPSLSTGLIMPDYPNFRKMGAMNYTLAQSGMSGTGYDTFLISVAAGVAAQGDQPKFKSLGNITDMKYTPAAASARAYLTNVCNWSISDGGPV